MMDILQLIVDFFIQIFSLSLFCLFYLLSSIKSALGLQIAQPDIVNIQIKCPSRAPISLLNIGATCYLNSAFQGISSCGTFVKEINNLYEIYRQTDVKKLAIFKNLMDILNGCSVSRMEISRNPIFCDWNRSGQQDSFELLLYAINQVYNELRKYKEDSGEIPVRDLQKWLRVTLPMRIILQYTIVCDCDFSTQSPLQSDLAFHVTIPINREICVLSELLDLYFEKDLIEDYLCDNKECKSSRATRLARLSRPLPRTICIHLQRTYWNGSRMVKINKKIKFGMELKIKSTYMTLSGPDVSECDEEQHRSVVSKTTEVDECSGEILMAGRQVEMDFNTKQEENVNGMGISPEFSEMELFSISEKFKIQEGVAEESKSSLETIVGSVLNENMDFDNTAGVTSNERNFSHNTTDFETKVNEDEYGGGINLDKGNKAISLAVMNYEGDENKTDALVACYDGQEGSFTGNGNQNETGNELNTLTTEHIDEYNTSRVTDGEKLTKENNIGNGNTVQNIEYLRLNESDELRVRESDENMNKIDATRIIAEEGHAANNNETVIEVNEPACVERNQELVYRETYDSELFAMQDKYRQKKHAHEFGDQNSKAREYQQINGSAVPPPLHEDDMLQKDDTDQIYKLVSVIVHSGNVGFGHYVCYKRVADKWFITDDSCVEEVTEAQVLRSQAYILFYEQEYTNKLTSD